MTATTPPNDQRRQPPLQPGFDQAIDQGVEQHDQRGECQQRTCDHRHEGRHRLMQLVLCSPSGPAGVPAGSDWRVARQVAQQLADGSALLRGSHYALLPPTVGAGRPRGIGSASERLL